MPLNLLSEDSDLSDGDPSGPVVARRIRCKTPALATLTWEERAAALGVTDEVLHRMLLLGIPPVHMHEIHDAMCAFTIRFPVDYCDHPSTQQS